MKTQEAIDKFQSYMRLRHLALSTEQSYLAWLERYMRFLRSPGESTESSEARVEAFLGDLAQRQVSASTQNQAFNALVMFYREVLGQPLGRVDALRANRPAQVRTAPTVDEVRELLAKVRDVNGYPTRLIAHLIYGCGLRVTEPCNLRVKDVSMHEQRLVIRSAKGGKDRVVALPCSLYSGMRDQLEAARVTWKRDVANGVPLHCQTCWRRSIPPAGSRGNGPGCSRRIAPASIRAPAKRCGIGCTRRMCSRRFARPAGETSNRTNCGTPTPHTA